MILTYNNLKLQTSKQKFWQPTKITVQQQSLFNFV